MGHVGEIFELVGWKCFSSRTPQTRTLQRAPHGCTHAARTTTSANPYSFIFWGKLLLGGAWCRCYCGVCASGLGAGSLHEGIAHTEKKLLLLSCSLFGCMFSSWPKLRSLVSLRLLLGRSPGTSARILAALGDLVQLGPGRKWLTQVSQKTHSLLHTSVLFVRHALYLGLLRGRFPHP